MKYDILITVLSWEDRFLFGLKKNLIEYSPSKIIIFKYNNPLTEEWKADNLSMTKKLLGDKLIIVEIQVSKPEENWFIFLKTFSENCKEQHVLLDSTTMTREALWLSLYNCKINKCKTNYVYYTPEKYSGDWISRDPGKPRLLYKMSGNAKLGAPTLLLVTCGYDIERLDSLVHYFEPQQTMIFFPNGINQRNIETAQECKKLLVSKYNIDCFYNYDPYDTKLSYSLILEKLNSKNNGDTESYLESHNIIFNSLGAKISAITLFKIWLEYPQVALSYIPSKEYNREYSTGIGISYGGQIF